MRSIRTKTTFLTVAAIIVAMTVATTLGAYAIKNIGESHAEQVLRLLCETGQKNLDGYFRSMEQAAEMVASFVDGDLKSLDDESLQANVERTRTLFERTARKTSGVLTYYYRIDPAVSGTVKGFWYTNLDGEGFREHEVTDITLYDTADTSSLVWFTVPKDEGRAIWLPPYITDNLDVRVFSYNVPVYCGGTFVGVIGIEIDYLTVASLVNSISLYDSGYAFINDAEGTIIYHPRMTEEEQAAENLRESPYGMLEPHELIHYTYGGVEKEAVWLPLVNGMRLNVTVPMSEINAEWHKWIKQIMAVAALLLGFFIIVSLYFTGKITKPLRDLSRAAEEVNRGNYDVSLDYGDDDEVGSLTVAFNKLIAHLRAYIRDLNDMAYGDALTAVRNKGAFDLYVRKLENETAATSEHPEFAICFFDCNDLRAINDRFGHDKGDSYLKDACTAICQVFSHCPVFRVGGDEFAAVLRNGEFDRRHELLALFDQRCADIRAMGRRPWEQVAVARGLAIYNPQTDKTVEDILERAKKAMADNKEQQKKML